MTAKEFASIRKSLHEKSDALFAQIDSARDKVVLPPKNVRRATTADLVVGAAIYHSDGDDGWFFNIVDEVHSGFYTGDDGVVDDLNDAWVDEEPKPSMEWLPIETLDLTKMVFVLVHQDGATRLHLWNPAVGWERPFPYGSLVTSHECQNPTHWMPLPAPPENIKEEE